MTGLFAPSILFFLAYQGLIHVERFLRITLLPRINRKRNDAGSLMNALVVIVHFFFGAKVQAFCALH